MNENKPLRDAFNAMKDIYIFDEDDKISFSSVSASLSSIRTSLIREITGASSL